MLLTLDTCINYLPTTTQLLLNYYWSYIRPPYQAFAIAEGSTLKPPISVELVQPT